MHDAAQFENLTDTRLLKIFWKLNNKFKFLSKLLWFQTEFLLLFNEVAIFSSEIYKLRLVTNKRLKNNFNLETFLEKKTLNGFHLINVWPIAFLSFDDIQHYLL